SRKRLHYPGRTQRGAAWPERFSTTASLLSGRTRSGDRSTPFEPQIIPFWPPPCVRKNVKTQKSGKMKCVDPCRKFSPVLSEGIIRGASSCRQWGETDAAMQITLCESSCGDR